jgi:TonB-linked SusC/RagA family outer membrane protein
MKKKWFLTLPPALVRGSKILRVMKLMMVMLVFFSLQISAAVVFSQDNKLSLSVNQKRIADVLEEIEEQTYYRFAFSSQFLDMSKKVSFDLRQANISEVLGTLFSDTDIDFRIEDEFIILVPKVLKNKTSSLGWQQKGNTISGKVTDPNGEPIPGASIVVKGTSKGTITDIDGNYTISEIPEDGILIFSFIGMKNQEVPILGKSTIDIHFEEETLGLDEIIVIGYGIQRKSNITGAISQVKSEDIVNRTVTRPEQALQGKTAGVEIVNTSGSPGSSPTVRIRGISSNSSSDPLYIVDGLKMDNIGAIDPNNIESMEVLKDAASAAIYGAEAGNGVILITTKKGEKGLSKITYDFQYVNQKINNMPDMMNAEEYITYMSEAGLITDFSVWENDGKPDTNWGDIAFESSIMQKHNLSFQGGNQKGNYFLSLSYLNNDGIVTGDYDVYKRLTATINGEYNIKPWLKVGTTNTIEKWERSSVGENNEYGSLITAVLQMDPLTPNLYDPDNLPLHMQQALQAAQDNGTELLTNEDGWNYGLSAYFEGEQVHPMIMRDRSESEGQNFNIIGTMYADFMPLKNLTLTSRLGYNLAAAGSISFSHDYYANGTVNSIDISAGANLSNNIYYQLENFANYNLNVENHNFTLMVGSSYSENNYLDLSGTVNKIVKDDPLFRYIAGQTEDAVKTIDGGKPTISRKLSYFGRFSYDYANKYFLQGTFRADAADLSILSERQRWGYFPAVSGGWTISEENFFKKLNSPVSFLKIRASWGQNGSIAGLGNYQWRSSIANKGSYPFVLGTGDITYQSASAPTGLGNENLKWETHEQVDIGLDGRLLNDRLSFTLDYFKKKTKDLILTGIYPSLSAGNAYPVNAGNIENSGLEFEIGWKQRIGKFNYSLNANLATLNNEVTYIHPSISRIEGASFHTYNGLSVFEEGYPAWYMRGYKFTGINDDTGEPEFADLNEDGEITDADKTMIGSAIPDYTYGITLTAEYKGFDFVIFGSGSHGNDIFQCLVRNDRPTANRLEYYYKNRWTEANPGAIAPKAGFEAQDNYFTSSAVVFDGSYFKIKQLQLGYTIPKQLIQRAFIENIRAYISLDDWFVFTDYEGFDPEASTDGGSARGFDKGSYPTSKKMVFGVNITF